jgi:hypothetical protein
LVPYRTLDLFSRSVGNRYVRVAVARCDYDDNVEFSRKLVQLLGPWKLAPALIWRKVVTDG